MSLADWPEAVEVEGRVYAFGSAAAADAARWSGRYRAHAEEVGAGRRRAVLALADDYRRHARAIVAALAARRSA